MKPNMEAAGQLRVTEQRNDEYVTIHIISYCQCYKALHFAVARKYSLSVAMPPR